MKNIFIIGAQRSGSTMLAKVLDLHPEIKLMTPIHPEPKYFLKQNYMGKEAYTDLFKKYDKDHKFFLEKSVSYFEHTDALKRINDDFPDSKVLIILRDPIDRCWSNYKFSVNNGVENREFVDAINDSKNNKNYAEISVNPFLYIQRGFYDEYLMRVFDIFNKKNIKVLIFEEFICSSKNLNNLFEWLNLDKIHICKNLFHKKYNKTHDSSLSKDLRYLLALKYYESILRLENLLEKKINPWREAWKDNEIDL